MQRISTPTFKVREATDALSFTLGFAAALGDEFIHDIAIWADQCPAVRL